MQFLCAAFAVGIAGKDMFTRRRKNYSVAILSAIVVTSCMLIVALAWPRGDTQRIPDDDTVHAQGGGANDYSGQGSGQGAGGGEDYGSTPPNDASGGGTGSGADDDYSGGNIDDDDDDEDNDAGENAENNRTGDNQSTVINHGSDSYYLLKLDKDVVRVFYIDSDGRTVKLEDTAIEYEALNPTDQELLRRGIKAKTQEELFALLQDYEE